jgi:hypothetical protein
MTVTELTEEVVFPLVRRRIRPREDEDVPGLPARRVLFVQTVGLALFVLALSVCALAWLVR